MGIGVAQDVCSDEAFTGRTEAALKKALEDAQITQCLTSFTCTWEDFKCTWDNTNTKIDVTFQLTQTANLADKTVLTDDVTRITEKGASVTFEVDDGGSKRATVAAQGQTATAAAPTTTCPADSIDLAGTCSKCPAGYGKVTNSGTDTCAECELGYYNVGNNVDACTQCPNSKTTMQKQSPSDAQCIEASTVCTVKTSSNSYEGYVPPSTARVLADKYLVLSCSNGYAKEFDTDNTFKCSTPVYPECYGMNILILNR